MTTANLNLPKSEEVVRVRMFDTTTKMSLHTEYFVEPVPPGHETLNLTSVGFVIDHHRLQWRVVFDLGCQREYWNAPPRLVERMKKIVVGLSVDLDASEVLEQAGIELSSVDTVIWSHSHFDHTGDMTKFPASTKLVVGPGFSKAFLPAYPTNPESVLDESFLKGRELQEIELGSLDIGGFEAYDFFGDASFYLLSAPGHMVGHVCGLARTTPETFVFLGGDVCHFPGALRPTNSLPLPDPVPENADLDPSVYKIPCACSAFDHLRPKDLSKSSETTASLRQSESHSPFYHISRSEHSAYIDRDRAVTDIEKVKTFDADPRVLVCLAHDPSLLEVLPTLNKDASADINNWKDNGWKAKCRWRFLNELPLENGGRGRPVHVQGFWRGGEVVDEIMG